MKFFQWILAIIALLFSLGFLFSGEFIAFLVAVLAVLVVVPPIQDRINSWLPWLKSRFLKLFLSVIFLLIALISATGNSVLFTDIDVCSTPANKSCDTSDIAFIENTQQINVWAKLPDPNLAKQVNVVMAYWPEPKQESEVFNQTFDIPQDQEQVLLTLDQLNLKPGNYRVTLTPSGVGRKKPLPIDYVFSVWTDSEDVQKRNEGEVENAGLLNNSVSSVKICEGSEDATQPCDEDNGELSSQIKFLSFTAEIPSLGSRKVRLRGDSEITFLLRYLGNENKVLDKPLQIFRETSELDRTVGTYTLGIPVPSNGFPAGEFELLTSMETRSSRPILKRFTIK